MTTTEDIQRWANETGLGELPIEQLSEFAIRVANAAVDEFKAFILGQIDEAFAEEEASNQPAPRIIV